MYLSLIIVMFFVPLAKDSISLVTSGEMIVNIIPESFKERSFLVAIIPPPKIRQFFLLKSRNNGLNVIFVVLYCFKSSIELSITIY